MKYPQLVSPRAVNAISDWLVSRLEQLGVESPQIYTRLLLSLLQSSVQVNDPIEFSNLEAFFANRKGGHKRFHLPSDTETLKKLNAVQCLREIVSNEQETATIEQLVEELCEKLKDIERQTQDLNNEERFLIETNFNTDSIPQTSNNLQQPQQQQQFNPSSNTQYYLQNHHPLRHQQQQQICNNSHIVAINNDSARRHVASSSSSSSICLNDIDNDPKKRYFRAFPALSKEMEDSFRIWRRNAKSLTWPLVGRSIVVENCNNNNNNISSISSTSSSSSASSTNSNFGVNNSVSDKIVEKKLKSGGGDNLVVDKVVDISNRSGGAGAIGCSDDVQHHQQQGAVSTTAASVKKKSKRRRNQALCKGKTIQNIRKFSVGTSSNSIGGNKQHHPHHHHHYYTHHRNSSPAWDTDFKGCWEMGPDLIKEFLSRQNGNNNNKKRNRSHSDSMDHEEHHNERKILNDMPLEDGAENKPPTMKRYIDISFCCDDDDDDEDDEENQHHLHHYTEEEGVDYVDEDYDDDNTLASVSELVTDNVVNPKRLYQREGHSQKSFAYKVLMDNADGGAGGDNILDESTTDSVDQFDFQQFKAKFDSNVEALWKDVEPATTTANNNPTIPSAQVPQVPVDSLKVNPLGSGGISSAFYATTSLNALAPFKQDLWNFWSNYNQQNYEQLAKLSSTASTSSMITTRLDDSSASSGAGADIANSSDYFSMPSNLDDFDKSVGGVRRVNEAGASLGAHTPSINVFLQNSIWSTSGDCVDGIGTTSSVAAGATNPVADTDDSFLFKVWHSNKKLSQLDVGNNNGEKMTTLMADIDRANDFSKETSIANNNKNSGANLQFPPYQNLKWSEGINAGPAYNSLRSNAQMAVTNEMESSLTTTAAGATTTNLIGGSTFNSAANITGATWEAPAYGQNTQPDLKSWCASNPMSLTEMYGNDVCDSIVNQPTIEEDTASDAAIGPAITLPNHCANTSGFVSYARIKQCGLIQPQTKPLQSATNAALLPKDFFRASEEENLLTSERTHFHPIENYVDGHTFDISNDLDSVEFERSESGLMRYDSEEFLEYTRNDIYMADEEVASSTNLLKFGKPVREEMFVIKFRVKRSGEIACQTEEQDFQLAAAKMVELPTTTTTAVAAAPSAASVPEMSNMFSNTFAMSRQANNEAIMAAVTKAVAAAAKAAAENHLNAGHFSWLPTNAGNPLNNTTTATTATSLDNNPAVWVQDVSICDEVDFCKINTLQSQKCAEGEAAGVQLTQNWSMQEVEKQCHQRRCVPHQQQLEEDIKAKFPSSLLVDIDRNDENSLDNSLHTLWGMCAVCNSCEYGKSMPANRLLRDELQLEADEIMSDLRYMQDLYIGESDILTDLNDNADNDDDYDDENETMKVNCSQQLENIIKNPLGAEVVVNMEQQQQLHDPMQASMLQKVNQLIEDLLKPENSSKLPPRPLEEERQEEEEYDKHVIKQQQQNQQEVDDVNIWNNVEKAKNLWQCQEEEGGQQENKNIWQHSLLKDNFVQQSEEKDFAIRKPMKLLKQVGNSLQEDLKYMENLNWEHDNLAKIWQPQTEEACLINNTQNEMKFKLLQNQAKQEEQQEEEKVLQQFEDEKLVTEKNFKNLQSSNFSTSPTTATTTPPSSMAATTNTYKRVQQFLNTSAAKIKLAANRKRRHSASQNFYQQQQQQHHLQNNNNNNNDNITDLNSYKQNLQNSLKEQQTPQAYLLEEQPTKQTIITCKYWTTSTNGTQQSLDSAAAAMMLLAAATNANNDMITAAADHHQYDPEEDAMLDENAFGNTFSCLIDKNASILKHVTMMTRPLTR